MLWRSLFLVNFHVFTVIMEILYLHDVNGGWEVSGGVCEWVSFYFHALTESVLSKAAGLHLKWVYQNCWPPAPSLPILFDRINTSGVKNRPVLKNRIYFQKKSTWKAYIAKMFTIFCENIDYFHKTLYRRCFTGFWYASGSECAKVLNILGFWICLWF